jgi:hypothetical protein
MMNVIAMYNGDYAEDFFAMAFSVAEMNEDVVINLIGQLEDMSGDENIKPESVKFFEAKPIRVTSKIVIN